MSSSTAKNRAAKGTSHNITEHREVFIVRITRQSKEHTRSFRFGKTGNKAKAYADAIVWRNITLSSLPKPGNGKGSYKESCMAHKQSVMRSGISRYLRSDYRRTGQPKYLCFGVNYTDANRRHSVKTFQVGRADEVTWLQELHASRTAEAFRDDWEWCHDNKVTFDPSKYNNWSTNVHYPFVAPS